MGLGPHVLGCPTPSCPLMSLPPGFSRHESHTWSLDRSESLTSDSQSGIVLSSVGTSKCNSPACVEARARRAAAYSLEERRRAAVPPYHDSIDSLRDSPHSERSVPVTCAHLNRRDGTTDLGPILWSPQKHSKEPHPPFSDGQARSLKSSMFCSGSLTC